MPKEAMKMILRKIREYDRVLIFRHLRMDGDCAGASKGLKAILKLTYPQKEVLIPDTQHSDALAFLGADDGELPEEKYTDALGIVLDTATTDRISNRKFCLCRELIKIDHHIPVEDYGDHSWVEENRSSACEMVACFYDTFKEELKIDAQAASFLYTGMVTDSGQFRFRSVSGDTMRLAGMLLDLGVDTDRIFCNLYLRELEELKARTRVYREMSVTENGVAYVYVSRQMKRELGLTEEAASEVVSYLEDIKGCLCWLAFIENDGPEHSVRVRLRSRFVAINPVAEKFRGGGHACACGATVYSEDEVAQLLDMADAHVKAYKETHEDWL